MIVGTRPRIKQIALEIWKPLTVLFAWDVVVTVCHFHTHMKGPPLPVALFGTALGLFLGFRTNAAYARWWEARTLWGALINASRNLARVTKSFIPGQQSINAITLRQIAFAHAMRCKLRGQNGAKDIYRLVDVETADFVLKRTNGPNALTEDISRLVKEAKAAGRIDTIQQSILEGILIDITNAQGGMERIKNTALPIGFRFLPDVFTRLFCVLLPIAMVESLDIFTPVGSTLLGMIFLAALKIGDDLSDPFANKVHDVPLTTMCGTIEIDLMEMLDRPAPPPAQADHGVLW